MKLTELSDKYKRLILGTDTDSHGKATAHFFIATWVKALIEGKTDVATIERRFEDNLDRRVKDVRRKRRPLTGYERVSALEEMQVYATFLVDLANIHN